MTTVKRQTEIGEREGCDMPWRSPTAIQPVMVYRVLIFLISREYCCSLELLSVKQYHNRDQWGCPVATFCLRIEACFSLFLKAKVASVACSLCRPANVLKLGMRDRFSFLSSDKHLKRHCLHFHVTLNPNHLTSPGHTGIIVSDMSREAHTHLICPLTPFLRLSRVWSWQPSAVKTAPVKWNAQSRLLDCKSTVASSASADWLMKLVGRQDSTEGNSS